MRSIASFNGSAKKSSWNPNRSPSILWMKKFLTKVLAIIEDHMDDYNFSIEELSREAGLSNMHFYRKLKGRRSVYRMLIF